MSGGVGGRKIVKYVLKRRKFYQSCTSDRLSASAYMLSINSYQNFHIDATLNFTM